MSHFYQVPGGEDAPLLPLLPAYDGRRFDYYCPGECPGPISAVSGQRLVGSSQCTHQRLTVKQAHEKCRELYSTTGTQAWLDQALNYMEYMPSDAP